MKKWKKEELDKLSKCKNEDERRSAFPGVSRSEIRRAMQEIPSADLKVDRENARLREEVEYLRKKYKASTKQSAALDAILEAIAEVTPAMLPVDPPEPREYHPTVERESAVLCLGDIHYGDVTDEEATGGIAVYNSDIARRRVEFTIQTAIDLCLNKLRGGYNIHKLYVFGLGDWVSGIIHDELVVHNERYITEQCLEITQIMAKGLLELCRVFPEVHFIGVAGNHGRVTQKPTNKGKAVNNYDYMVAKYLEMLLRDQPNLTFQIPRSFFTIVEIEGVKFMVMHGDEVKSWGGIPWYGLNRMYLKMKALMVDHGISFDHMVIGHLHSSQFYTVVRYKLIINGSTIGGDEFSVGKVTAANDPTQWLFGVHPRRGITFRFEINSAEIR